METELKNISRMLLAVMLWFSAQSGVLVAQTASVASADNGSNNKSSTTNNNTNIADSQIARILRIENGLLPELVTQDTKSMRLADRMQYYKTPAISIAVIEDGKIAWARAYGVADLAAGSSVNANTLFQAASISKPVAAMTALRLVEMKKLNLDEDINNKLTSWKVSDNELTETAKVTLRRILAHRAGINNSGFYGYSADKPIPTLLQILKGEDPANHDPIRVFLEPQSESRYSGGAFTVMQQWIADVSGKNFAATVEELVLSKIGMSHSTYNQPPSANAAFAKNIASGHAEGSVIQGKYRIHPELAAAGLWTTPSDLAQFAIELANAANGKSSRVLSKEMAQQMLTPQAGDEWGLGIMLQGKPNQQRFSHNGANAGFRSTMVSYKNGSHGAVVMTNSDSGMALMQEVLRAIADEYKWQGYMAPRRTIVKVPSQILAKHIGYFENNNGGNISVREHNGQLYARLTGFTDSDRWTKLLPGSEVVFYPGFADMEINFTKNASGETIGASVREGLDSAKQLTRTVEKPPQLSAEPFYLRGSMNAWSTDNRMQSKVEGNKNNDKNNDKSNLKSGDTYTTMITLKPGKHEFKFGSADYKKIDFGVMPEQAPAKLGEQISIVPTGENITIDIVTEGRYVFTLFAGRVGRAGDAKLSVTLVP